MSNFWTIVGAILVSKSIFIAIIGSLSLSKKVRRLFMTWAMKFGEEFSEIW